MSDLRRLREAVEAGQIAPYGRNQKPMYDFFKIYEAAFSSRKGALDAYQAYSGSLDAAKALHEALLPEWFATITRLCDGFEAATERLIPTDWRVDVSDGWRGWPEDEPEKHCQSAEADNPARAWLLAILRALTKREEG